APVKMGVDGGMNATFLTAVKSHGGPGASIRTAAGTIPPHVNPPAERESGAAGMGGASAFSLASAESRLVPAPNSTVQVASASPEETNGEPQRNTASTTGALNGAAPTVPSGGFEGRFGAWN